MHDDHIFTVSALTNAIKGTLENSLPFVWVRGQVANLSRPSSGHLYFSLKDEASSIAAVWFKGSRRAGRHFDPLTGEVFEDGPRPDLAAGMENGQELLCAGRIAVYPPRGVYQLVVEIAQDAGLGRLHAEFARLTAKLEEQGYFALERKRALPYLPRRVALVTAPTGAALQDFLRIGETRGLAASLRLYPTPVQGEQAPPAIQAALARIAREGWAEVIVLIRGGGSLEDLWAFNDQGVAGAVFRSPIPVLAGIGHEVDFTLADMTADVRAATPSHAAQLLWPDRSELYRQLDDRFRHCERSARAAFARRQDLFARTRKELEWHSPRRVVEGWAERLSAVVRFFKTAGPLRLGREELKLAALARALSGPPASLPAREQTLARLKARLDQALPRALENKERTLSALDQALARSPGPRLAGAAHALDRALLRLEALDPHAPLSRGYALARKADGRFVRCTRDVLPGEALTLTVSNGDIPVRVEKT